MCCGTSVGIAPCRVGKGGGVVATCEGQVMGSMHLGLTSHNEASLGVMSASAMFFTIVK